MPPFFPKIVRLDYTFENIVLETHSTSLTQEMLHSFIPIFPFCLYERANPEAYIEALSLNFFDEFHKIIPSCKVVLMKWYHISFQPLIYGNIFHAFWQVPCTHIEMERRAFTWPLTGSWTFQNTYVCITSRPPSLALAMSVGHICQFFSETWRINHGIDWMMECITN